MQPELLDEGDAVGVVAVPLPAFVGAAQGENEGDVAGLLQQPADGVDVGDAIDPQLDQVRAGRDRGAYLFFQSGAVTDQGYGQQGFQRSTSWERRRRRGLVRFRTSRRAGRG